MQFPHIVGTTIALLVASGAASADDWKANATRLDAIAKAFDKRQFFTMPDPCKAEYVHVSPNRKDVSSARIDLKLVNGESVQNGAGGSYTEDFNFSKVDFDCQRGNGQPNCTSERYSFGHVPVKPGDEPEFCKHFLQAVATCQGVASFKPSRRGCQMSDWEKEFVRNGPPKKPKPVSPFGR